MKNNKGFTLAEIIICIAITAIISAAAIFMVQFTLQSFYANRDAVEQKAVSDGIKTYIMEELRYAKEVIVGGESPGTGYNVIQITGDKGRLYTDKNTDTGGLQVFPYSDFFYMENKVEGTFQAKDGDTLQVNLSLTDRNDRKYEEEIIFNVLNYQLSNDEIISNGESSFIYYK